MSPEAAGAADAGLADGGAEAGATCALSMEGAVPNKAAIADSNVGP